MQAQTQKMKGELLFEFKAKNNSTTIKDIGPNGVQLEMNDHGEVSGKYHAGHIDTVSVRLKTDGTNDWQLKSIHNTKDRDMVVVWGGGEGRRAGPHGGTMEGGLLGKQESHKPGCRAHRD